MSNLTLNHIYKVYDNGVKAVNDFTMEIGDREFIVLVGPSGCGKSTTLRMIAGLEEITAGELTIGDTVVNAIEPKDRDIAMVFQNYALYPHMTVYENIAFGLKIRKIFDIKKDKDGNPVFDADGNPVMIKRRYTKEEVDVRVREAAEILGITEYLERKPKAMSGGQRQRVALGRAIVREPKVFLLDEPLSNLDAKLRTQMRAEITKLYQKLQTTFVYVTHDQTEAMTMGTRIVVMKDGFIQQIDNPANLYKYPCNKFVAGFIGTPQMNFFAGKLKEENGEIIVTFDGTEAAFKVPHKIFIKIKPGYTDGNKPVIVGLRSEHISIDPDIYPFKAKCKVSYTEELGIDCQVYADFDLNGADKAAGGSRTKVIIKAPSGTSYEPGEIIEVSVDFSHARLFDAETEMTILPRIPEESFIKTEVINGSVKIAGSKLKLPPAISAADGKYLMRIVTDGITFGGEISAIAEEIEDVNGIRLVRLNADGNTIFAADEGKTEIHSGDSVKIDIDLKKISLINDNGCAVKSLEMKNTLKGGVSKHTVKKEIQKNGRIGYVKELQFTLDTEGYSFDAPVDIVRKLVGGAGKDVFKKALTFCFSPYDAVLGDNGFDAEITEILDYGKEKFAKCLAGSDTFYVAADETARLGQIKISLCADRLDIIETERDIRLV